MTQVNDSSKPEVNCYLLKGRDLSVIRTGEFLKRERGSISFSALFP